MKLKRFLLLSMSAAFGLSIFSSCTPDIVRVVERDKVLLKCSTNEPFTNFTFNLDYSGDGRSPVGSGKVEYRRLDPVQGLNFISTNHDREPGTPQPVFNITPFELDNGIYGYIREASGVRCMDDMAGTQHNFFFTITNWGGGANSGGVQKNGCCSIYR